MSNPASSSFDEEWERWDEAYQVEEAIAAVENDNEEDDEQDDVDDRIKQLQERETASMSVDSSYQTKDSDSPPASPRTSTPQRYSTRELVKALGSNVDTASYHPQIQHRIRDFRLAQRKRRETFGTERPWGILGLYDHLASIRIDLEWAEDAAWRRNHGEPYLSWTDFNEERNKGARNRPLFTYFMMIVCTIMLLVSIGVNGWKVEPLSVNPMIGPSAETLIKIGAKKTSLIVNGEWFRLFSPMVLHAGIIHWLVNMLALWFIGGAVEKSHGLLNATILFCLPAIGGTILSAIFLPEYISVGASGGIFGMIGACIADIILNWNILFLSSDTENLKCRHAMVLMWLIVDIAVNCLIGLTPFVDNFVHLGGMIYGILCGFSTIERVAQGFFGFTSKYASCSSHVKQNCIRFFGLILSVIGIMVTVAVLVSSDGTGSAPCHACRYISCMPFPPFSEEKWWHCDDCQVVSANASKTDGIYSQLDLTCPNGEIADINVFSLNITDSKEIQRQLPMLCRDHCESVYQ